MGTSKTTQTQGNLMGNNADELDAFVETYIVQETSELIYDDDKLKEWNALTEGLGLEGQNSLTKSKDKSPIPFLPMNDRMEQIFKTLCPTECPVEEFQLMPIPLEILKLLELSKRERYFGEISIRYDEVDKEPVVIGWAPFIWIVNPAGSRCDEYGAFYSKEAAQEKIDAEGLEGHAPNVYRYLSSPYLIGRWADVKENMEALCERAKARYIKTESAILREEIKLQQAELSALEDEADLRFG